MRETCTSGSVRGEGGNILTYSAQNRRRMSWRFMLELQTILPTPRVRSARAATPQSREWRAVVGMPYNCRCRNSDPIAQTQAK